MTLSFFGVKFSKILRGLAHKGGGEGSGGGSDRFFFFLWGRVGGGAGKEVRSIVQGGADSLEDTMY